jgi:membrane fusion protein (multidrug efflux system)
MRKTPLLILILFSCSREKGENKKVFEEVKAVNVEVVKPKSISKKITVSGTIKGYPDVLVYPDLPGRILKINVQDGQFVSKGQVLALLDRSSPGLEVQPLTVEAPTSGYVQVLVRDEGFPVSPQTPIFRIVGRREITVLFDVPEIFAWNIRRGNRIYVEGKRGEVIRFAPALDPRTRTLKVEGKIEGDFLPGQSVLVEVEVQRADSTVVLPVSAFVEDTSFYVFVLRGDRVKRVPVRIGIRTSEGYQVVEGLKFGDTVVVFGANTLKDGSKVKVVGGVR